MVSLSHMEVQFLVEILFLVYRSCGFLCDRKVVRGSMVLPVSVTVAVVLPVSVTVAVVFPISVTVENFLILACILSLSFMFL